MLRRSLQTAIKTINAGSAPKRFFSACVLDHNEFHKQNEFHLDKLITEGLRTPVCTVYLRSRKFLLNAAKNNQLDIDTPNKKHLYVTRKEMTDCPTPSDFILKRGLVESIKRFPDSSEDKQTVSIDLDSSFRP